jgi:tRNA (guanine-N7-)-methyltransferase
VNFLGIEWTREFYLYAADRVRRRRERGLLANVRLLNADATSFLRWRVPDGIVRVVHLYFSDPWPKTRHHKKRVVQDRFMADVWRVLEPGGELRVVTDHDELWAWDMEHFERWTGSRGWDLLREFGFGGSGSGGEGAPFEMVPFDRPESAEHGELVGTNFERKFRRAGKGFHAAVLRKAV